MRTIHFIGDFSTPFRGAELSLLDLAQMLEQFAPSELHIKVWSAAPPHPSYARHHARHVQHIREFAYPGQQAFPVGGHVVLAGIHVPLGPWLAFCKADRVILQHNIPQYQLLYECVEQISKLWGRAPEITFVSPMLQVSSGLPGFVHAAPMLLDPFWATQRQLPHADRPFVVGRLSSDSPSKHHPQDLALYRSFAARGMRVRIMGGTCLADGQPLGENIELLPMGYESSLEFLQSIDLFIYRTNRLAETFGRVIFEAMASGLPVVAQSYAGYTAYLHNGTEIWLADSQEEAFTAVCALSQSAQRYADMSRAGKIATERVFNAQWRSEVCSYYI